MLIMKNTFASLIVFALFLLSSCQSSAYRLQKQGKIVTKQFSKEIPFEYFKKVILMEAEIDGETYTFIYDTGAEITLLDEKVADKISMKKVTEKSVSDSYKNKKNLPFYVLPDFKIGGVDFEKFVTTTVDISALNDYLGCEREVAGILGNNIFRKAVWKIDYQKELMSFANTIAPLQVADNKTVINFPKRKIGNAYIPAKLNGITRNFLLDTGYAGSLASNQSFFDELKTQNDDLSFAAEKGIMSISIHGFNYGIINHVLVDSFSLANINLSGVVVALKENKNASTLIGNEFLKNFIVTFDWKNGQLFLEKTGEFNPEEFAQFEYDILPMHEARFFKLSNQWLSHPTTFDINPENIIQSINGVNLTDLEEADFCNFKDNQLPKFKDAEEMKVVFKEEDTLKTVTLHKRQLLNFENN